MAWKPSSPHYSISISITQLALPSVVADPLLQRTHFLGEQDANWEGGRDPGPDQQRGAWRPPWPAVLVLACWDILLPHCIPVQACVGQQHEAEGCVSAAAGHLSACCWVTLPHCVCVLPRLSLSLKQLFAEVPTAACRTCPVLAPLQCFTVKMSDGVVATSYSKGDKFFIDPMVGSGSGLGRRWVGGCTGWGCWRCSGIGDAGSSSSEPSSVLAPARSCQQAVQFGLLGCGGGLGAAHAPLTCALVCRLGRLMCGCCV
jgi:hypothetical protein